MKVKGKNWLLVFSGLLLLTGCQGNTFLETSLSSPCQVAVSGKSQGNQPATVSLGDIPTYPQAVLVATDISLSQYQGKLVWESVDRPDKIINYYQQQLRGKKWETITTVTSASENASFAVKQGNLTITVSILSTTPTRYSLQYSQGVETTIASSSSSSVQSSVSSSTPSIELSSDFQNYIDDFNRFGIAQITNPNQAITRRQFAQWLFQVNNKLFTGRSTQQIRLANNSTSPVFTDVPISDPDFPIIQGLAEAGIIPSSLSKDTITKFRPDEPLTREEMILWKVALDNPQSLPNTTVDSIKETWGFQDVAQINPTVLKSLAWDYQNGDKSNIRRVFGLTRLLQPKKVVTQGEASAILWYFGSSDQGLSLGDK